MTMVNISAQSKQNWEEEEDNFWREMQSKSVIVYLPHYQSSFSTHGSQSPPYEWSKAYNIKYLKSLKMEKIGQTVKLIWVETQPSNHK